MLQDQGPESISTREVNKSQRQELCLLGVQVAVEGEEWLRYR